MSDHDEPYDASSAPAAPSVTVVIPARNEEKFIGTALDAVLAQDHHDLEVIVVDGQSDDATADIVRSYMASDPRVRLLDNPQRIVPTGLNLALAAARGTWLVRVDAHATVPSDYVRRAVAHLETGRYGGVGGRKDGVGVTPEGKAVAAVMQSRFGVGNSTYHHGTEEQLVEHVPFGAYPVALARSLGGWDEDLAVNQDFEFDYRVRAAGHSLLFDPTLVIHWHCRQSIAALYRQYRRYGKGKVKVIAKHPGSASPRHLAAPGLVANLVVAGVTALRRPARGLALLLPYAAVVALATARTRESVEAEARPHVAPAFVAMHVGWGVGFWRGVAELVAARLLPGRELSRDAGTSAEFDRTP